MRILHVLAGSLSAGAARGALWLHAALVRAGCDSRVLSTHDDVPADLPELTGRIASVFPAGRLGRFLRLAHVAADILPARLYPRHERQLFSTAWWGADIAAHPWTEWAEVIHLHWVNAGMISLRQIARLPRPVVWTLRDMWPLTGGCHYALACENYRTGCGNCPRLGSRSQRDLSRWNNRRKRAAVDRLGAQLQPAAISSWLAECAGRSTVFAGREVKTIFNCVDPALFTPLEKDAARAELGWGERAAGKKVVLCGAFGLASPWKGFDKFMEAYRQLGAGYQLALFGDTATLSPAQRALVDYDLGILRGTEALRGAYSAADVFAAPSLQEAFGKTLAEAMSCATPVVAFDATGPRDIVAHRETGYLAAPFEPADYAAGLRWCCANNDGNSLGLAGRARVGALFSPSAAAAGYLSLYENLLARCAVEDTHV